jgi:hypothetical protein
MANKTITDLDAITSVADGDLLFGVDVSDTTDSADGTNKKFTFSSLVSSVLAKFVTDETVTYNGWTPIADTPTYASSTTVTISGDHTGKFAVGDKIKLTQQTTVKYFYVTSVTYGAPNTTLTLYAGTDYTVANAAITSPYYSKMQSPVGFPDWFAFTPSWTNLTLNSGTTSGRYCQMGKTVFAIFKATLAANSTMSASDAAYFNCPVNADTDPLWSNVPTGVCFLIDSGAIAYSGTIHMITGRLYPSVYDSSGTYTRAMGCTTNLPFTWGPGDVLVGTCQYEAA